MTSRRRKKVHFRRPTSAYTMCGLPVIFRATETAWLRVDCKSCITNGGMEAHKINLKLQLETEGRRRVPRPRGDEPQTSSGVSTRKTRSPPARG